MKPHRFTGKFKTDRTFKKENQQFNHETDGVFYATNLLTFYLQPPVKLVSEKLIF